MGSARNVPGKLQGVGEEKRREREYNLRLVDNKTNTPSPLSSPYHFRFRFQAPYEVRWPLWPVKTDLHGLLGGDAAIHGTRIVDHGSVREGPEAKQQESLYDGDRW